VPAGRTNAHSASCVLSVDCCVLSCGIVR